MRTPKTAIVIGGNMMGCLAAEVLSKHLDRVLVIEKGDFDDETGYRKSVPQEHHVHLLLLRGKQIFENIFPGFLDELGEAGAEIADLGHDVKWYQYGRWKNRYKTGISAHYCSRRLIDNVVRKRVRSNEKVKVISYATTYGLCYDGTRVSGVKLRVGGSEHEEFADLVVDASGRGSRSSEWIGEFCGDKECVQQDLVETRLGYASRIYRRDPKYRDLWKVLLVLPKPPQQRCMGVISPIEGDRWLVTTGGWFGHYPKPNPEQFLDYLGQLPVPDIYEIIRQAEPLSDVFGFGMPGSLRRRFDLLTRWPEGYFVLGDALYSLNPLYSQGMTLCALEANCFRKMLGGFLAGRISAHEIQKEVSKVVEPAWNMATEEDLRFPETIGHRTPAVRLRHWYGMGIGRLSAKHRLALKTQIGVTNLVTPSGQLFRPEIVGGVLLDKLTMFKRSKEWL
ncbi:NAD(P)/FAD-dependent oxidoreductase [Dyella psychrodurans]|uniref:FAD-dependent oxidoreductase n=1 Tax=Dyella psychrodurans TaxID=1927960 RepID=A0A370X2K0_9GAMM|nr:FAD-dependent oxidoreductase [Dyella psychrodurans]RDS82608.1 FAD-dependent oxidoreductase [Dyella psychrodurans]